MPAGGHRITRACHDGLHHLTEALDLVASSQVTPAVETFDSADAAVDRADRGQVRFRAVVTY